jgi:hypothetical protein
MPDVRFPEVIYGEVFDRDKAVRYLTEQKILKMLKTLSTNMYFLNDCKNVLDKIVDANQLRNLTLKSPLRLARTLLSEKALKEYYIINPFSNSFENVDLGEVKMLALKRLRKKFKNN